MELRDFAEQVLFGTTLEEKLRCPDILTDAQPGTPFAVPEAPGRPAELRFKGQGSSSQSDFPGLHRMEKEEERGRLLHFFANHELLATELMALALLRFPGAPAAFRRGVLQTLKDEQMHTRLYLTRMKQCGIEFGEIPVSGYFWRSVASMENPIDYVAGLSLTFEQANLDFCRHFARAFDKVGDNDTARLLERVYRDEIGHVAYGLKWFRRWKNPEQSDWEAFCRQLKFPLSPQRAKGLILNVEARRSAGFDPGFIAELNVYSQSKGRTPAVFVFNPFAEAYIARGRSFTPVKHQTMLANDLANLPQFLCRQDDIVLVPEHPSVEFLSGIKEAGFALPEFVGARTFLSASLADRKIGSLRPWAWGPDSVELLQPLFANVTGEQRAPEQRFNERIAQLYSKAWSAAFLGKILARFSESGFHGRGGDGSSPHASLRSERGDEPYPPRPSPEPGSAHGWLCTENEVGVAASTLEQTFEAIAAIRVRGHHKIVVKEAHGLAGHNAIRLWEPQVLKAQRRWMVDALQGGRQLVVEPWLERALDLSVQLEMEPHGLKLCGYTGLINDRKGQFQANWAAPNYNRRLPARVSELFHRAVGAPDSRPVAPKPDEGGSGELRSRMEPRRTIRSRALRPVDISDRLQRLCHEIFSMLEEELESADYLGPVGIDAFVYITSGGEYRFKPVVEINPRYTMGRLAVELMKRTCPGTHGLFRLVSRAMARGEGFADFAAFAASLKKRFPLRLEGEPVPKIKEGALCLNDPARAQVSLAVFQVGSRLEDFDFLKVERGVHAASTLVKQKI